MAGDWIKIREGLHEDPAILQIATELGTRPEHVVGYCHRFWGWVSRNSTDGIIVGVTVNSVESVLNLPGFLQHLCAVEWLEQGETEDGRPLLVVPKFDRHLSNTAKKRAEESERKRKNRVSDVGPKSVRDLSENSGTKNGQKRDQRREEKRRSREEKKEEKKKDNCVSRGSPPDSVSDDSPKTKTEYTQEFESFWSAYPKRGGKRRGKQKTFGMWRSVPASDRPDMVVAARNYGKSKSVAEGYIRDPERFLAAGWWKDWVEPEVEHTRPHEPQRRPAGSEPPRLRQL